MCDDLLTRTSGAGRERTREDPASAGVRLGEMAPFDDHLLIIAWAVFFCWVLSVWNLWWARLGLNQ